MQTTQKQEEAILKIAFVLVALLDNVQSDVKKVIFREYAKLFPWFKPGDKTTNAFFDGAISTAKKILQRRDFIETDEYLDSFITEVDAECKVIMKSEYASRLAFFIWVAICMSVDYTVFLKTAVKKLQSRFVKETKEIKPVISDTFLQSVEDCISLLETLDETIESPLPQEEKIKRQAQYETIETQLQILIESF